MTKMFAIEMVIGAVIILCAIIALPLYPQVTQGQEIGMVQPKGWIWSSGLEKQQANNNLVNSEANVNNGQARVYDSQARNIQAQTDVYVNRPFFSGMTVGLVSGCGGPFIVGMIILCTFAWLKSKSGE